MLASDFDIMKSNITCRMVGSLTTKPVAQPGFFFQVSRVARHPAALQKKTCQRADEIFLQGQWP